MAVLKAGNFSTGCRAVLFDKDGTLIDFKNMWLVWLDYMFNTLRDRYQLTKGVVKDFEVATGVNLSRRWIEPTGVMASGCMESLQSAVAHCLARHGVHPEEAAIAFNATVKASETEVNWPAITHPVPGLAQVLSRLKSCGIKLAVTTADTTSRAEDTLNSLGLCSSFDVVVGADRVAASKPAPDMARLACELLGVDPNEAVVVGDNITDMQMGKSAGVAGVIGVLTGVSREEHLNTVADAVVDSVADLKVDAHAAIRRHQQKDEIS